MKSHELRAPLHDAQVVIFGGATGIGLATAELTKERGARLTLVGRTLSKLELAAAELGGARVAVADIANRKEVEAVFAGMQKVDHLIVTAGSFIAGKVADSDPDELFKAMQERIAGPLYAIKAALPLMGLNSTITLTSGQLSDRPVGNGSAVISAAVGGVEAMARSLALELQPIRVNVVSPGWTETPLLDAFGAAGRNAALAGAAATLPVRRVGQAPEIASAIVLLLTNKFINGEVMHVDGGGRLV